MDIMGLREHSFHLRGDRIALRPMTENDWLLVAGWETDPEILYWSDGSPSIIRTLDEVQYIFRSVSRHAYCFIVEFEGKPIGDCWLQEMNLQPILQEYQGKDCRRIDLVIGEKGLWGKGLGTDIIRTLTSFAFGHEKADMVFGLVFEYNVRSRKAFEKAGYRFIMKVQEPSGSKVKFSEALATVRPGLL